MKVVWLEDLVQVFRLGNGNHPPMGLSSKRFGPQASSSLRGHCGKNVRRDALKTHSTTLISYKILYYCVFLGGLLIGGKPSLMALMIFSEIHYVSDRQQLPHLDL